MHFKMTLGHLTKNILLNQHIHKIERMTVLGLLMLSMDMIIIYRINIEELSKYHFLFQEKIYSTTMSIPVLIV